MFRQMSGSSLCYACGKLNRVDAAVCFYCGARHPGLWGFGAAVSRLVGQLDFGRAVTVVCAVAYLASLALSPGSFGPPRGMFDILAPGTAALNRLGMTGSYALSQGRWWTLVTAIYLHAGLLHILFNMLWVNQLSPAVEAAFGRARLVMIFTAGGVAGFVISDLAGVTFSVGASGAVFGLLGALVFYGRSRGGSFGLAVFRQYGQWALVLLVLGFLMPGINNLAHAGGFAGGYLSGLVLGHEEHRPEPGALQLLAAATVLLTAACFALAIWTAAR
jgi:membrane associated rhomboid family serine protease